MVAEGRPELSLCIAETRAALTGGQDCIKQPAPSTCANIAIAWLVLVAHAAA